MFQLLIASILVLMSSIATAAVEEENCHGDVWDGRDGEGQLVEGNVGRLLWMGTFRHLGEGEGDDGEGIVYWSDFHHRRQAAGAIENSGGLMGYGGGDETSASQLCFSLQPFTTANTNNGERCTNGGPLPWETSTKYYRMQIDRSSQTTRYCQIMWETADSTFNVANLPDPRTDDTCVVDLDTGNCVGHPDENGSTDDKYPEEGGGNGAGGGQNRGQPTAVPTMPVYLLMGLSGLLALFGFYRVRVAK